MALSASRLKTALKSAIISELNALVPINPALLAGEQALATTGRANLAEALATAIADEVVAEITGFATVPSGIAGIVSTGAGAGGITATTAPGTVL